MRGRERFSRKKSLEALLVCFFLKRKKSHHLGCAEEGGLPKNHKKKKRQSKKIEERGVIGRKHNPLGEVRESTTVWKSSRHV